ncbi:MAG TPA: hypothetical protein DD733_09820 [Clostridiales bacterium]|nr:hypothetical protein [Eubacteriales bacterium]HBR32367.1 hypothetical protein [Clostridiales bacterium]
MSASLRNFLITFGICLIVFGLLGRFVVYPLIGEITPGIEESTISEETVSPGDILSEPEVSAPIEGDIFTAVIVGKSSDGQVTSIIYFRANEITKRFSYSFIPIDLKMVNSVGVDVPLRLLIADMQGAEIAQKISAATGITINHYCILGTDELLEVSGKMTNPYIDIASEIKYINPERATEAALYENPDEIPQEFYINIGQGRKELNAELFKQLIDFDSGNQNKTQTKHLYETIFMQFFTNPGTKNDSAPYQLLSKITNTNVNSAVLDEYIDILFTYDVYQLENVVYPTKSTASSTYDWEKAVKAFRTADGR